LKLITAHLIKASFSVASVAKAQG